MKKQFIGCTSFLRNFPEIVWCRNIRCNEEGQLHKTRLCFISAAESWVVYFKMLSEFCWPCCI